MTSVATINRDFRDLYVPHKDFIVADDHMFRQMVAQNFREVERWARIRPEVIKWGSSGTPTANTLSSLDPFLYRHTKIRARISRTAGTTAMTITIYRYFNDGSFDTVGTLTTGTTDLFTGVSTFDIVLDPDLHALAIAVTTVGTGTTNPGFHAELLP